MKLTATVVKHTGSHYLLSHLPVWDPFPAVVRGKLRLNDTGSTNPIAVGDVVEYEGEVITSVLERRNCIVRSSTNLSRQRHVIAANIDMAWLVVTLALPETKQAFIDRFLVTCEAYKVPVTILLNKADLYKDADIAEIVEAFRSVYEGAGYRVLHSSVRSGEGIETLRAECSHGVNLFSGVSGVGKSSLIKALDPNLAPRIGAISEHFLQGRHTTTFYEMYPLAGGGTIIDTPGIRGFGLVDFSAEEISTCFPEMLAVMDGCRYKPCTHTHEPGCAVLEAIDDGRISPDRYNSYLGMLEDQRKYR